MHRLSSRSEYCCGRRKYNRRRFQCKLVRNRYRVLSLNYVPKTSNKKKPIDIFLAATTTRKPEVAINLGGNEGEDGGEEFPFGKIPEGFFKEKSGGGEEFPFGKLPERFFNKKDTKETPSSVIGKSGGGDQFTFDKMPQGFFKKEDIKTTSTPLVISKSGSDGDLFSLEKVPGDNFFDKFVSKQSKTTAKPVPGREENDKKKKDKKKSTTLFELPHEDLIKELEKYEEENKDKST